MTAVGGHPRKDSPLAPFVFPATWLVVGLFAALIAYILKRRVLARWIAIAAAVGAIVTLLANVIISVIPLFTP